MNIENCALKLVDEIILYYDARSKKQKLTFSSADSQKLQAYYGNRIFTTPFLRTLRLFLIFVYL